MLNFRACNFIFFVCLVPAFVVACKPADSNNLSGSPYCPSLPTLNPVATFQSAANWDSYQKGVFCNNMTPHWEELPVPGYQNPQNVDGCNYFVFPQAVAGAKYSRHFDPTSPYFEAFFGVYVVAPLNGKALPLDMAFAGELGVRDNQAWLYFMGDPNFGDVTMKVVEKAGVVLYEWHVDTGDKNPTKKIPPLWKVPKSAWNKSVNSYQDALQVPTNFLIWQSGDYLIVNFAIASEFTNKQGATINTYKQYQEVRDGFAAMTASIQIVDDGGSYRCAGDQNRDSLRAGEDQQYPMAPRPGR